MTKIHPFTGAWPVFLREMLILRRRMPKQLASWLVSPLLYFTAFTCAMGGVTVNGLPYIDFLVPGLVAMASMTQAWAIAVDINIARFYWHMLDEFRTCPLSASGYVAGETAAGIVRAMGASVIIMIIGTLAGVHVNLLAPGLWLALVLNAWFFSGLAIMMAMLVKSHADQALLSNFVITPMAFLGGTFFPLERLPEWARHLLGVLPLPHAAGAMQAAAAGRPVAWSELGILAIGAFAVFLGAVLSVSRARS